MQKFFVETNQIKGNIIYMTGTDVHHIRKVLRYQVGDTIQIGNKQTKQTYLAEIEKCKKEEIVAKIVEEIENSKQSQIQIDLYQGLPKADKMEWIIQKTTELGIHAIIPVSMERSIVKVPEKEVSKKVSRWQKIAEVAAKQCKRQDIPEVLNIWNLRTSHRKNTRI